MARGWLQGAVVTPQNLTISDPSPMIRDSFTALGVNVTGDNSAAVSDADIVAVVVKPWLVHNVINGIKHTIDLQRQTLLIIAAGVKAQDVQSWLSKDDDSTPPFFLVIPNTAIEVLASMTFIVPVNASSQQTELVTSIYSKVGRTLLTSEQLLPAATTLASCGIAYAMRYVRAATQGGVEIGFKADIAKDIVLQTVQGAVQLLQATGHHPEAEIDKVTTPGGVTIKGLNEMEHAGFTSAVIRGLKAGLK